jgi:hypothetical protein
MQARRDPPNSPPDSNQTASEKVGTVQPASGAHQPAALEQLHDTIVLDFYRSDTKLAFVIRKLNHRRDLAEINKHLDTLEEHYANLRGVTKEIDDLRRQVRAVQRHLGLAA